MNDDRSQQYLALIQEILNCPNGEEGNILNANMELVDLGLVNALLQESSFYLKCGLVATAERLTNLAQAITNSLQHQTENFLGQDETRPQNSDELLNFLVEVLQAVIDNSSPQIIYPILVANQAKLTMAFAEVLKQWALTTLSNLKTENPDQAYSICAVLVNFSILIQQFPTATRWINLEISITAYESVLTFFNRPQYPSEWAATQINLAAAYYARLRGDRAENIELAIASYKLALEVKTRQDFREDWAATQNNLASAYIDRIRGNRAENIELAISFCNLALKVYNCQDFPVQWAMIQNNLAIAYNNRLRGDRAENIELAIASFNLNLEVRTRQDFPVQWATIQNNLASAYNNRLRGDRAENIELAIASYRLALEVKTHQDFPVQWAMIQNNLANAYIDRIREDHAENIELAIASYRLALEVRTRQDFREDWAATQNNLANAYSKRIRGDRAENIELAIDSYRLALEVRTHQDFREDWATTQNNLASAYIDRIRGDRAENIELAIDSYRLALEVRTHEDFREDWAATQNNLANAYSKRIRGDRAENIELAIDSYRLALEVRTHEDFREDWAATQNNLANAYFDRLRGDSAENIELAIASFNLALQVYTRQDFPVQWAMTQNNLANAYYARLRGDHAENIELAIASHRFALEVRTPTSSPYGCLRTGRNLGELGFKQGLWHIAIEGYSKAIEAVEKTRSWSKNDDRRQEILRDAIEIYNNAIQSYINLGQYDNAIALTERARSRHLVELMASNDLYADGNIPPDVLQYLEQYEYLERRIETERQRQANDNNKATISDRPTIGTAKAGELYQQALETVQALMAEKTEIWRKLRELDPVLAGAKEVSPPDFAAMQKLLEDRPHSAIVSFYSTNEHTHIFVLRQTGVTLHTCTDQGYQNLQVYLREKWLKPYEAYRVNPSHSEWKDNIKPILIELSQRLELNQLITNHLQDIDELIIIPHIYLHLIPFAALPIDASISPRILGENLEVKKFLSDRFRLRILPSCQILEFCQARKPTAIATYTTIENATDDLIMADFECEQIAKICNIPSDRRIQGSQNARREKIAKILLDRTNPTHLLHASHHAGSNLNAPLESALQLANQEKITLGQLLSPAWRMLDLEEVFLSCCETNLTDPNINDDILTIGTGFLCAGARSVISTLWSVNAFATALFCIFYYQERNQKPEKVCDRPTAIHKAQKRLRELKGAELSRGKPLRQALNQYLNQQLKLLGNAPEYQEERLKLDFLLDRELPRLAEQAFPFEHPVYWSGFIAQGVA